MKRLADKALLISAFLSYALLLHASASPHSRLSYISISRKELPLLRLISHPSAMDMLASLQAVNAQLRRNNAQLQQLLAFDPLAAHDPNRADEQQHSPAQASSHCRNVNHTAWYMQNSQLARGKLDQE